MAGIFPSAGISAPNTTGADPGLVTVPNCDALFYRNNCQPRFDPVAMNAVISELGNAINGMGVEYDCSKLDNLKRALAKVRDVCSYETTNITLPNLSNDFVLGCWGGKSGKIPVQQILDLVWRMCSLETKLPDTNDFLAGCFDDAEGKVTVQSLIDLVLAQIPAGPTGGAGMYRLGGRIATDDDNNTQSAIFDGTNIDGIYFKDIREELGDKARFGTAGNLQDINASGIVSFDMYNIVKTPVIPDVQYTSRFHGVILKTAPKKWYRFNSFGVRAQDFGVTDDTQLQVTTSFQTGGNSVTTFYPMYKL